MDVNQFHEWEQEVNLNSAKNESFLMEFANWLSAQNIMDSKISNHLVNVHVFANTFLVQDQVISLKDGISHISEYFSDFFIQNAPIANEETLTQNTESLLLFYQFLLERNIILNNDFDTVNQEIKQNKTAWIETCRIYHSGCEF
jgi:hypothetical protein